MSFCKPNGNVGPDEPFGGGILMRVPKPFRRPNRATHDGESLRSVGSREAACG